MCHRSGPVELCEYFEKKLLFLNIKSATGPDLWSYVKKNAGIYKMCHRSGPMELCEKMLQFIKGATGPDLWNYVKKCWNI